MTAHWTDEQLIAHLYGIGPDDRHVESCAQCQARLSDMQFHRQAIERDASSEELDSALLAAQRREIHRRIAEPVRWWSHLEPRRWAAAAVGLLVLAGGLLVFDEHRKPAPPNNISDAQLALDVSRMAEDPEPPATAPLQALFEE